MTDLPAEDAPSRLRGRLHRIWVVTALSVAVVLGLSAVLMFSIVDGLQRVEQADLSEAIAETASAGLTAATALNHERSQILTLLLDRSSSDLERYNESFAATDDAISGLRLVWSRHHPDLSSQTIGVGDFLTAASAVEDIRSTTVGDTAEGQFAAYTAVVEPLIAALRQLLGGSGRPETLPDREALVSLINVIDAMERRRALIARSIASGTAMNQEDRVQLNILNQSIRSSQFAAGALLRDDLSEEVRETRTGTAANQVDEIIEQIVSEDPGGLAVSNWFAVSDAQVRLVEGISKQLVTSLENRNREIQQEAERALFIRWVLFVPLVLASAVMGISAVRSSRERVHALSEYNKIADGLIEWFKPEHIPDVEGVEVAVRYRPSSVQTSAGGDWYDVFELGPGRVGLVIGDVVGHGPQAASHMAELQHLLRGQATAKPLPPSRQLELLEVSRSNSSVFATLIYAVLDTVSGQITFSRAGHVPLCIVKRGGIVDVRRRGAGPPIGADFNTPRGEESLQLDPDDVIMLMTDGLVEIRSRDIDEGLDAIAEDLAGHSDGINDIADILVPPNSGGYPYDDLALLLVRWQPGRPSV